MNEKKLNKKIKKYSAPVRPFIYERPSLSNICIRILVLLALQLIALLLTKSYQSLYVVLVSVAGAIVSIILTNLLCKRELYQSLTTIIQAIFIGLFLPSSYPLVPVFFISFFCLFISYNVVFNKISSWINVSAAAVVIAWFIGNKFFPDFIVTSEYIPLKNTSWYLIQNGSFPIYNFDSAVTSFLNNYLFKFFKVTLPDGYVSLFVDTQSVIPAFRFNFLTIISAIILFSSDSFSEIIPIAFLFTYGLFVRIFVPYLYGGLLNQGDIILAFLTSGSLFSVVFLLQWFGTTPLTVIGKVILGLFAGIFAFITSGCGTSPIGMVYTVLISNILSLIIRVIEEISNKLIVSKNVSKYITGEKVE